MHDVQQTAMLWAGLVRLFLKRLHGRESRVLQCSLLSRKDLLLAVGGPRV